MLGGRRNSAPPKHSFKPAYPLLSPAYRGFVFFVLLSPRSTMDTVVDFLTQKWDYGPEVCLAAFALFHSARVSLVKRNRLETRIKLAPHRMNAYCCRPE